MHELSLPSEPQHLVERLEPKRLSSTSACAAVMSLPTYPGTSGVHVRGILSQSVPIAWWNEAMFAQLGGVVGDDSARRQLLTMCSPQALPESLSLVVGEGACTQPVSVPQWRVRVIEQNMLGDNFWEVGELIINHNSRETALRLGLNTKQDGLLWWEWLTVETLWQGPACQAIRCTGYIPERNWKQQTLCANRAEFLHKHRWIFGDMLVLMFANGVIQVTARHINNRLYDHGRELNGVLPVLGLRGQLDRECSLIGEAVELDIGDARLSTVDCKTLASPEAPGRIYPHPEEAMAVVQPYQSVAIGLSGFGHQLTHAEGDISTVGDPDNLAFPRGASRTVRFNLSLSHCPPVVERYVLPYWWYGLCAELAPRPLLPVRDELDSIIHDGGQYHISTQQCGGFDDGSIPRHYFHPKRKESGWEGETPYSLIRYFYRNPTPECWSAAVRANDNNADIVVNHADFTMRMHGYDFGAISPTMNRSLGLLQGYLETGDPYLRETCEHVAMTAYCLDRSNWPRRAYGRDAMYIRGLVLLEDYLPGLGHGARARDALGRMAQTLTEAGCVHNQSGTVGLHAQANGVTTPWQNFQVLEPVMDWLDRHPDDQVLKDAYRRICDWLVSVFVESGDGGYWPYICEFGDNSAHPRQGSPIPGGCFKWLYPAKPMLLATRLFADSRYLEAWKKNLKWLVANGHVPPLMPRPRNVVYPDQLCLDFDHNANKAIEGLSWYQMHIWQARWSDNGLATDPFNLPGEDLVAEIITPAGPQAVTSAP